MFFPRTFKISYRILAFSLVALLVLSTLGMVLTARHAFPVSAIRETTSFCSGTQTVELPILMYHHILKKGNQLGDYTITPAEFEQDLQYIRQQGYTTIVTDDLVDYVYHDKPLPENPIMITFDDGYYSNYVYAYPLLRKYEMKAVISIVGRYTDLYSERGDLHINYSHVNWDQLLSMENSGIMDVQNHTYDLHSTDQGRKGCRKKWGESSEDYKRMLYADVGQLSDRISEMLGKDDTFFTYPFGAFSDETLDCLKEMGFLGTLSSEAGLNYISRDPNCLYHLKRFNRPHNLTTEDYFAKVFKKSRKGEEN